MQESGKKTKYFLICVLILAATIFLMDIISINVYGENQSSFSKEVLPTEITYVDYEVDGLLYKAYGGDPQMHLPIADEAVNCLIISFAEPMREFRSCRLYYASEGEGLTEERAVNYTSVKETEEGIIEILIELPEEKYSVLRLDLDGTFSLKSVVLSRGEIDWIKEYRVGMFSLIAFVLCAAALVGVYIKEKNIQTLEMSWLKFDAVRDRKNILKNIVHYFAFFLRFGWLIYVIYICCFACTPSLSLYIIPIFVIGIHIADNECIQEKTEGRFCIFLEVGMSVLMYVKLGSLSGGEADRSIIRFEACFNSLSFMQVMLILALGVAAFLFAYMSKCRVFAGKIADKYFKCDEQEDLEQGKRNARVFTVLAFVFGMVLIYIVPPTTVPDEDDHYASLFRISRGHLFNTVMDGAIGSYYTEEEMNFLSQSIQNYVWGDEIYSYEKMRENEEKEQGEAVFYACAYSTKNPIPYLFAATGVAAARKIFGEFSPFSTILWAKFFHLLFYILVTRVALKKTALLKNTMLLIALMPMTIYQCTSVSYDAALIPCMFLLFAYGTRLVCAEDRYVLKGKDIFSVLFACFFIFGTKIAYAPLVLVFAAIPIRNFGGVKKYMKCIAYIILICIVSYMLPNIIYNQIIGTMSSNANEIGQTQGLLSDLSVMPRIMKDTINQFFDFYIEGFVGYFGWFDTRIPSVFIVLYCMVLGISAAIEICVVNKINIKFSFLSMTASIIFVGGTLLALYRGYNPLIGVSGGTIAYGFQGRYLIPVALFVIVCFSNRSLSRFIYKKKMLIFNQSMVYVTATGYLVLMSLVLYGRYWM